MNRQLSVVRVLVVWVVATLVFGVAGSAAAPVLADAAAVLVAPTRFGDLLVLLAAVATTAGGCWLWLLVTLVAGGAVRGRLPATAGRWPRPVVRALLVLCGVAGAGGLLAPAYADGGGRLDPARPAVLALHRLPLPERPVDGAWSRPRPAGSARSVVVRPGQCLWTIAAAELAARGRPADPSSVADRWREIYAANHALVGPDPDLLLPGLRLVLPPPRS